MTTTTVLEEVGMDPAVQELENLFRIKLTRGCTREPAWPSTGTGAWLWIYGGGLADDAGGTPVAADTMFILYSSTKPLAAACLHILWERGQLDWDDTVAQHWPEFAKHGKDAVTIRHILTHRRAVSRRRQPELSWDRWQDWDYCGRVHGGPSSPDYPAGQIMAYHPRNFGWVIGEVVRRIDGRHIGVFLREEILDPLGLHDGYVGLPPEPRAQGFPHPRHGRLRSPGHDTPLQPAGSAPGGASRRRRNLHRARPGPFSTFSDDVQRRGVGRRPHPQAGDRG